GEKLGQTLQHTDSIYDVSFSPDRKTVVTAGFDRVVRVWNVAEKTEGGRVFPQNTGAAVRFLPDGRSFMTSDASDPAPETASLARIRLWDCESGIQLAGPFGYLATLGAIAFTSDGRRFARGNYNSAQVFRADNGQQITDPLMHPQPVRGLA